MVRSKVQRIQAAIRLEAHDRIPVVATADFWPVGMQRSVNMQQAFYDVDVLAKCYDKAFQRWNAWDGFSANLYSVGGMLDAVGSIRYSIPGRELGANVEFQHPDLSLMSAAEYGELIRDPVKFQAEVIIPRLCQRIGSADRLVACMAMAKAALFYGQWRSKVQSYTEEWNNKYSIPPLTRGASIYNPLDWIAGKLRGFRETLLDIRRRPEVVAEACEALVPFLLTSIMPAGSVSSYPLLFNPQHVPPFIGPTQYEQLYWPTFKRMVDELSCKGYGLRVFLESNQEQHLDFIADLPNRQVLAHFEGTSLAKARKILGGKVCIAGGVPPSLLSKGTAEEVHNHIRALIDCFGDEPGFILAPTTTIPTNARPENIDALLNTVIKYGSTISRNENKLLRVERNKDEFSVCREKDRTDAEIGVHDWEGVVASFGKIAGDESIIKSSWEELEELTVPFLCWLIK